MKAKTLLLALLLTAPFAAGTPPQASVLLRADSMHATGDHFTAVGRASAIIKGIDEEVRVRADQITFNPNTNSLECAGSVEVTVKGQTISAKELTIRVGEAAAKIHMLQSGPGSSDLRMNRVPERN